MSLVLLQIYRLATKASRLLQYLINVLILRLEIQVKENRLAALKLRALAVRKVHQLPVIPRLRILPPSASHLEIALLRDPQPALVMTLTLPPLKIPQFQIIQPPVSKLFESQIHFNLLRLTLLLVLFSHH